MLVLLKMHQLIQISSPTSLYTLWVFQPWIQHSAYITTMRPSVLRTQAKSQKQLQFQKQMQPQHFTTNAAIPVQDTLPSSKFINWTTEARPEPPFCSLFSVRISRQRQPSASTLGAFLTVIFHLAFLVYNAKAKWKIAPTKDLDQASFLLGHFYMYRCRTCCIRKNLSNFFA